MENMNTNNKTNNMTPHDYWNKFIINSGIANKAHASLLNKEVTNDELIYNFKNAIRCYINNCFQLVSLAQFGLEFSFGDVVFDTALDEYFNSSNDIFEKIKSYVDKESACELSDEELNKLINIIYPAIDNMFKIKERSIMDIAYNIIEQLKFNHMYSSNISYYFHLKQYETLSCIMYKIFGDNSISNVINKVTKCYMNQNVLENKAVQLSLNYKIKASIVIESALSNISKDPNYAALNESLIKAFVFNDEYFNKFNTQHHFIYDAVYTQLIKAIAEEMHISVEKLENIH